MNALPPMPTANLDQPRVLVMLDDRHWLLPQTEAYSLESLLDIDSDVQSGLSLGALALAGQWWPVYSLSGELALSAMLPESRRLCLLLDNGADRFGLAADRVEMLKSALTPFPLPACMATPGSPVQGLVRLETGLGYVTDTERLAAWLAAQIEDAEYAKV